MQIRVLQLVKGVDIGNHSGGSDKFGLELTKALKRMGVEVYLACLNSYDTEIEKENLAALKDLSVPVVFLKGKSTFAKIYSYQLASYCLQNGINIVNSHFQVGTLAAMWASKLGYNGKIARTAHIDKEWGDGAFAWLLRQVFTKFFFPLKTDLQVGVSLNIVNAINGYPGTKMSKRKAVVIYNGILHNWFEPAPGKKYPSNPRKTIGAIGLLIERKGYQYLVAALPKVLEKYPESELIIAGEGDFRPVLERQIRELGLQNKVRLLGRQADIRYWLEQMDLFVLPSLIEGFPTVIIESMARGVPVVASDIPGNDELILDRETGWLVRARSSDELADTILRAFADPLLYEKVSAQAFERAQELTIENAAKEYAALYEQLIKDLAQEQ
jgi:glycosyltransferase involved in cell wall biosynthesis